MSINKENVKDIKLIDNIIDGSQDISYDNSTSGLTASNVSSAIDELQNNKASVDALASNINLFPSTSPSDVTGYSKLVTSKTDPDYDTTAVDIPTGPIGTTETLVGSLVSEAGLVQGDLAGVTVTTVGNIEKTAGNNNRGAHFYFKVFHRDSSGTETLLGEANPTAVVYETDGYEQFATSAYLSESIIFTETDRIVYKFYGEATDIDTEYNFQFGGDTPIRCLLPVPISVIPSRNASETPVDSSGFSGVLSSEANVQEALDTLDGLDSTIETATQTSKQEAIDEAVALAIALG